MNLKKDKIRHEKNPFTNEKEEKFVEGKKAVMTVKGNRELTEAAVKCLTNEGMDDTSQFTKISQKMNVKEYYDMTAKKIADIYGLTRAGRMMVGYILNNYRRSKNPIRIITADAVTELNYANRIPIYRAIDNLTENNLLANGPKMGQYWVNRNIISPSEKFIIVKEMIRKDDK